MSSQTIALRIADPTDEPFLFELFCAAEEFAYLPDSLRDQLLRMQYNAQRSAYRQEFPESSYQIVVFEGQCVGKVWLASRDKDFFLVDIGLLPEYRGKGIGSRVMTSLQDEARAAGKPVRCSVSRFNAGSFRFHLRHGFVIESEGETHFSLVWS